MEVKKYYPRVQKFLTLLIVFLIVALLSVFEGFVVISSFLNFLAAFLMSPTLLILGFLMVLKKHKPGTIFFIANIIFIIGLLVFLFTLTNVLPTIFLGFSGINIYQICLLISLALYSIGIASKINEINELSHQKELESIRAQQLSIENKEISKEKKKAEKALNDLKATQALLIQNEKMASFGELTAGIAHEIQNPLNFVNNFSEISVELSDELQIEANKPDFDRDLIIDLAKDLKNNQEKINLHGKRASSIVKGMLEHSRKSSGTKEATDLNVLADEYLRLAYHGLRAKDKSFNAKFQSELDEKMPLVEVIPQDMGRVILNLITNAFYAVNDKSKKSDKGYEPTVIIGTKLLDKSNIIITVKDNGSGIPDDIKDKIFQPFFTTKPTGQSTGLGLSLAYDIVKAHGGLLKVESKEGVGTEFIIQLPLSA
ncbi:MAG TPA: ATP-binding protein, partial [Saprospiraceae bacterium]|nr:ATP-binding protein [Saprospiraceae bacterium]